MGTLSTHVLDTSTGRPAEGLVTRLSRADGEVLGESATDSDGRVGAIGPEVLDPGDYVLSFATGAWFERTGAVGFYPRIDVVFTITDGTLHYHVPVLLSPFGYATYRGS